MLHHRGDSRRGPVNTGVKTSGVYYLILNVAPVIFDLPVGEPKNAPPGVLFCWGGVLSFVGVLS